MSDEWVKAKLESIDGKVDAVQERLGNIDVTLAVQALQLETHIKRTELAEENITLLRADVKPIQKHVDMLHGAFKLIGIISTLCGLAYTIIEIAVAFNK